MTTAPGAGPGSPWSAVPARPPYVLERDRPAIERFNARCRIEHRIELAALPEPFVGPLDAPVVLLSLNPGWNDEDPMVHSRAAANACIRGNLAGRGDRFYHLQPALAGSPGEAWWRRRLAPLVRECGEDRVAGGLLVVEWFPYHSRRFAGSTPMLPSQEFGFDQVRRAVARGAWIVCLRSTRRWQSAVPGLRRHARFSSLANPRNATVSPRNCPGFAGLVDALA